MSVNNSEILSLGIANTFYYIFIEVSLGDT